MAAVQMPTPAPATATKVPRLPLIIAAVFALALVAGVFYLNRPAPKPAESSATAEAKAYLPHLELADLSMQANENFMHQQVVEIEGSLGNKGPRTIQSIDVYCLFYGVDGREIHRERVPVMQGKSAPLRPGETRRFRLPFDSLPGTWNQALPKMVIARIGFAG